MQQPTRPCREVLEGLTRMKFDELLALVMGTSMTCLFGLMLDRFTS